MGRKSKNAPQYYTVGDFKKYLEDNNIPDHMVMGNSGHFGELLNVFDVSQRKVSEEIGKPWILPVLCISIEDPGEEPD